MLEPDPELAVEYGIFSVRQAHAAGFGRAEVERLVRRGTWVRRGQGVLAIAFRSEQKLASQPCAFMSCKAVSMPVAIVS